MSQIKIYGNRTALFPIRQKLSDVLHACIVEAFKYPENKRAHRFFYLDEGDFYYPEGRTAQYTIIEISLFEGRSIEAKKALYQLVFSRFELELGIAPNDVEITLTETPTHNWGIRGKAADELMLDYKITV
ncbi:tautomerase family protein [Dyadobacter chenwenxiniae]|uniref:Tautomerase family protein n=1 Tax=Dyadobacter chenwenxiniae TaxID=2906456 RepID=A0A9X1PRK6_9BACT|nr:tautomerase family protein [Dyadobacter chenwenxiniae]MCF0065723.1 tautomerase family protein [Dyadobacter chenwenxiniae]UON82034.1 tautomerase family protein [Dyadobacter chenwenxiniae]